MADFSFTLFNASKLSLAVIDAWNEAMSCAASEARFPDARFASQDVPGVISSTFHATLSSLARQVNARAVTARLPVEVLSASFGELTATERMRAARVSKQWYTAITASASIWHRISCNATLDSARAMVSMLRHAAQSLIELDVVVSGENEKLVIPALEANIHRCTQLKLAFTGGADGLWPHIDEVRRCLGSPAPHLRQLIMYDEYAQYLGDDLTQNLCLFGGESPRLNLISFALDLNTLSPIDARSFAQVTTVTLQQIGRTDSTTIRLLLSLAPTMRYLRLCVQSWNDINPYEDMIELPPSLYSLDIIPTKTADSKSCIRLLRCLRWQHLHRVSLQAKDDLATLEDMIYLFQGFADTHPPQTAWIGWADKPTRIDTGVTIFFSKADLHANLPESYRGDTVPSNPVEERSAFDVQQPLAASLFTNITQLYLHELVFDPDVLNYDLPTFPLVSDLRIMLMDEHFLRHHFGTGPFLNCRANTNGDVARVIHCPVLRLLSVSADLQSEDNGFQQRMTPRMACDFVHLYLQYDLDRLLSITFVGVEFVVGSAEEFDEMIQLADIVDWDGRYMAWTANLDAYRALNAV